MFSKKILSLISVLFTGSQIISMVTADCVINLTVNQGAVTDCAISQEQDVSCNEGYYAVYQITQGTQLNDDQGKTEGTSGTLVEIDNQSSCSLVQDSGYFKSTIGQSTKYIAKSDDNVDLISELAASCSEGQGGSQGKILSDNSGVCLDNSSEKLAFTDGTDSYMVKDVYNKLASNEFVVLKGKTNALIVDNKYMGKNYNLCIDNEFKVWDRKEALCESTGECTYYNCGSNKCIVNSVNVIPKNEDDLTEPEQEQPVVGNSCDLNATDAQNCEEGYYIVDATSQDNTLISSTTYMDGQEEKSYTIGDVTLYECSKYTDQDQEEKMKCETPQPIPIGYLVNNGNGQSGTAPYIECSSAGCKPISVVEGTCGAQANAQNNVVATGSLYIEGQNTKLCIFDSSIQEPAAKPVILETNVGKYFVSISSALFGITAQQDHFIIVETDVKGNVKVVKDNVRYRYVIKGEFEIKTRPQGQGQENSGICAQGVEKYEYVLDNFTQGLDASVNYYINEDYEVPQQQQQPQQGP